MFCHARSLLRRPNITLTTTILRTLTTAGAATYPEIPLLQESTSYTVTPPIKPWTSRHLPKRSISMITHQDNLDLAFQVFDYAGKYHPGFSHTHATYHSIIDKLSRARAFDAVESLLSQLSRSSSHIKCGDDVFISVIRNYGLADGDDSQTCDYTTILGGFVSRGDLVNAEKVFSEIFDKGWSPDAITYTVLMVGYCKQGRLSDAIKVMDNMEYNGMEPNEITYGVMIDAYCKEKRSGEARNLIDDMLDKKFLPSSTLCWMCERGELNEAGRLWDDMVEKRRRPHAFTYNMLIKGFTKAGNVKEGIRILEEMLDNGCLPNKSTYTLLIEGLQELGMEGDVDKVVSMAMASREVDADSWDLFLHKIVGNLDCGTGALDRLLMENAT
uniref:Pentacotripeptide-repeat region of PRORP domain-containing protein n=1 Tax=Salix viminalis TaxID=40686 RepID=A0A6N2KAN6_SALVM